MSVRPKDRTPPADDLLLRAAARLREGARYAPPGPYTLAPHTTDDGTRWILGPDGDPIASAHDWAGGHGLDLGEPAQTGAHLRVWTPRLALADWLETVARQLAATAHPGWWEILQPHAYATARAVLEEDECV